MEHGSIHTVRAILHMRQGHLLSDDLQLWGNDVTMVGAVWGLTSPSPGMARSPTPVSGRVRTAYSPNYSFGMPIAALYIQFTVTGRVSDTQLVVNVKDLLRQSIEGLTDVPK
jgi:hypothetical protein